MVVATLFLLVGCQGQDAKGPEKLTFNHQITTQDFTFSPSTLQVESGTRNAVKVTNEGGSLHNLTIEGRSVDKDIEPGASQSVTFEAGSIGTVSFYCKYHKASGMVGTLTIT